MSTEDHHHGFAAAIAALLGEFNAYLSREGADPLADSVSYRQFSLWLSDAEKAAFIEEVVVAIRTRMDQGPPRNAGGTWSARSCSRPTRAPDHG